MKSHRAISRLSLRQARTALCSACNNAAPAGSRRLNTAAAAPAVAHSTIPPALAQQKQTQSAPPKAAPPRCAPGQPARRNGAPSNPAIQFPCLDALDSRSATLEKQAALTRSDKSGPEPSYTVGATQVFHCEEPLLLDHGGQLHEFDIAYETWGEMNPARSNVILLHTGLSASSHAHSTPENPQPGWWEKFIGPGLALDTNKYFVVCTNVIGGCYGSTGPASIDPSDGERYATRFPILTIQDMVRAQFRLLDHLGVDKLHASVGSSMGGMQSLAAGVVFPSRVGRIVSISACARSHPYSIAMRYVQRRAILNDPNWNRGFYYGRVPPHVGMKLAREIATITYRSGPEWEQRFSRRRADPSMPPALCPDFLVETYLDHAGEKFCLTYDPNSLLYVSKAMDLFDLGLANQRATAARRAEYAEARRNAPDPAAAAAADSLACNLTLPDKPYEEQPQPTTHADAASAAAGSGSSPANQQQPQQQSQPPADLVAGLATLREHPVLVMGVASDILFPAWQQREVAEALRLAGSAAVEHRELSEADSLFGHDTFLLDVDGVGGTVKRFLG